MSRLLEDVRYLAHVIGPRGTGTSAEAKAADYVSNRLREMGLQPTMHSFRSVPSQNSFPKATSLLALLAVVLYPMGGATTRWLAILLSAFSGWSLWQTIRNSYNPLRLFLPKVSSQNVEARLPANAEKRNIVVLLAHLDTNRCRLVWQSGSVHLLRPMTRITLLIPICMSALFLIGAITEEKLWWWCSFPLAAYQIGTICTLVRDDRLPYSPGAHDNAASVAIALEVAQKVILSPLAHTEVWLIFDGAEETDHAGVLDLLRRHGKTLREAIFIALEGLGSGEVVYLTEQGVCAYYRPSAEVLALAEAVARENAELKLTPSQMAIEDDVRALRQRGYRALCLAGRDPQTGVLPYWHRPDDTPQFVSPEVMQRAVDILCAIIQKIDQQE